MENEVLDYVMNTPGNTNPAILGQMIQRNSGGGGGGSSRLVVHVNHDDNTQTGTLDKTWQEIWDAFSAGNPVVILDEGVQGEYYCFNVLTLSEPDISVEVAGNSIYFADSKEGYPYRSGGED